MRELSITLFGATGFVGRLTAAYLAEHAPRGVRIALAGRDRRRLVEMRRELPRRAARWPLVIADASDPASLRAMAEATDVIVTTVGPYLRDGLRLVEACAAAGTNYADLTGEVLFMRESIDRCHARARRSGARIVHSCGFDSIPSDLGVLLLHDTARERNETLEDVTLVVRGLRGGLSGGTIASMKTQLDAMRADRDRARIVFDPYALSPARRREPRLGQQRDLRGVTFDSRLGMWIAPFIMASTNTRVVRRSNALQEWAYGRRFRYREVTGFGSGMTAPLKAAALTGGLALFAASVSMAPLRRVADRVLPQPGEGPSERTRTTGYFRIDVHGFTSSGAHHVAEIRASGDPGYAATAVMLGESALSLACDMPQLPDRAGVLTPATAMGGVLVERLRRAGQRYSVHSVN